MSLNNEIPFQEFKDPHTHMKHTKRALKEAKKSADIFFSFTNYTEWKNLLTLAKQVLSGTLP